MTDTQRGVALLLKSAVTGAGYVLPDGFLMKEAADVARQHHIVPLVYTGAVRCGIPSGDPVMQRLFREHLQALVISEHQLLEISRIFAAFDANGIDYLPLKGCNMKHLYPKPDLRVMGDADILIRTEQYDRIRPVMKNLGFTEGKETDHELIWQSGKLFLELHKHLIPTPNRDYYDYFGNGWQLAHPVQGCRYAMDAEDEFIFLFTHYAKHYRDGGAGCRYVLDLWVYRRAHPQMDEARIRRELGMLRLGEFYENTLRLMACWFDEGAADPVLEHMSDYIFSGGTWGSEDSKLLSRELRQARDAGSIRRSKMRYLLFVLFPPAQIVGRRYPIVKRHRWLLPLFWPVRWVTALLFRRENIRREQTYQQTVSPEHVRAREASLRYVGLDFHF